MIICNSSFEILQFPTDISLLEKAGRVCYLSEPKGNPEKFVKKIIDNGHLSVIEHLTVTVRIICDRAIANELVRHRLCSFSQTSTRYVNYSKKDIEFIKPCFWQEGSMNYESWIDAMTYAELYYIKLIKNGATPQEARSVLPSSLKTEIICSCNLREWLWVFKLRCSEKSHIQMREIMIPLREEFTKRCPVIFG